MDEMMLGDKQGDRFSTLRSLITQDPLAPDNRSSDACSRRLRLAAQMSDDGIQMMRMKIRRDDTSLSSVDINRMVGNWLAESPEPGFVEGFTVRNLGRFVT